MCKYTAVYNLLRATPAPVGVPGGLPCVRARPRLGLGPYREQAGRGAAERKGGRGGDSRVVLWKVASTPPPSFAAGLTWRARQIAEERIHRWLLDVCSLF